MQIIPCDRRRPARVLAALLALIATPHLAQVAPRGPEFQVNSYTTDEQSYPAIAVDAGGELVVVWHSRGSVGPDDSGFSVQARRFAPDGRPLGQQFQVNGPSTTGGQHSPAVGRAASGEFVVVWDGPLYVPIETIEARRFEADGSPVGDSFVVGLSNSGYLLAPDVAAAAGGDFVVVWQDTYSGANTTIKGRRYLADGTPTPEFLVNSSEEDYNRSPSIDVAADGRFVVAWQSFGSDPDSGLKIRVRAFGADGAPLHDPVDVNTVPSGGQIRTGVAMAGDGRIVVTWTGIGSPGNDDQSSSIQARLFAPDGIPAGPQFQVNVYTPSTQRLPEVAWLSSGGFVVAWESDGSAGPDKDQTSIQARRFRADGSPDGEDWQVNTYSVGFQSDPHVASASGADFAIVWTSDGSAGTDQWGLSVQGQRFGPFFGDGFETGDVGGWTLEVP